MLSSSRRREVRGFVSFIVDNQPHLQMTHLMSFSRFCQIDIRGVPGCELAATAWPDPEGPAAQCGAFKDHNLFEGPSPTPPTTPTSPTSPTSPTPPTTPTTPTPPDGLMNEGVTCAAPCGFTNDQWGPTRDCPQFCGTGTCCSAFDWRRGAPGCELAVNVTGGQMVCGEFRDEGPALQDFRTGMPRGVYPTSSDAVETGESAEGRWIKDIVVDGSNPGHHFVPEYNGEGGQPWSQFEMSLIRDLLVFQMRQATGVCNATIYCGFGFEDS